MSAPVYEPMVPFEKYDALVQLVAQMKREGFSVPTQHAEPTPQPELPKVILRAITDITSLHGATGRHLVGQAWEMIAAGIDENDIATRIAHGEPTEL